MYRLMVMARMVNNDTAKRPYRSNGHNRHNKLLCTQSLCQNVLAAKGKLKQQNNKSDNDKLMINAAVAFRTWNGEIQKERVNGGVYK